jgi:hypothetical protein
LPESDLSSPLAVIWCDKKSDRSPLILSGCGLADPRETEWIKGHPVGDRTTLTSEVERAYLGAHFYDAPERSLERATMRPWMQIRKIARRLGIKRNPDRVLAQIRKGTAAARSLVLAPRFNDDQRAYIQRCFTSGYWPRRTCPADVATRARNEIVRDEITHQVAEMGHPFSWDAIASHAHERQPGAQRWREKWDREKRRTGKFAPPAVRQ